MLFEIFAILGLNEDEAKTYITLLESGPLGVSNLAKVSGKPRPSLYGFLKRLEEKGMVSQSTMLGVRTYLAESPAKVNLLFRQKIEELEVKQRLYKDLLPGLEKAVPSKFLTPKFQLYEKPLSLQNILKDLLLYRDTTCQTFWPIKDMVKTLTSDFFRYFNKERIKNNIYTEAIWPSSQVIDFKKHPYLGAGENFKREIRIAPEGVNFSMGYIIYKNKVAFLSSQKENFGFVIESRELADMMLSQFHLIWQLSKKVLCQSRDIDSFLEINGL
ncbi:MAG: helix-turn-helix domain-containing protein [Candidatus Paceibacterota bacterium]|jgi:sugar-specific transcriptional regulator TrmB